MILFISCYTLIECKDTYPPDYWNVGCDVGCKWLKQKNKCTEKWKDVFSVWKPKCKEATQNFRHYRVDRSCRKTCQICGRCIYTILILYKTLIFGFITIIEIS